MWNFIALVISLCGEIVFDGVDFFASHLKGVV